MRNKSSVFHGWPSSPLSHPPGKGHQDGNSLGTRRGLSPRLFTTTKPKPQLGHDPRVRSVLPQFQNGIGGEPSSPIQTHNPGIVPGFPSDTDPKIQLPKRRMTRNRYQLAAKASVLRGQKRTSSALHQLQER